MKEYLSTLNTRNKCVDQNRNVPPRDVVLLVEPITQRGIDLCDEFKKCFQGLIVKSELYASGPQERIT